MSSSPSLLLSLPPETLLLTVNYLNRRGWTFLTRECYAMVCLLAIELNNYCEDKGVDPIRMARNSSVPPFTSAVQGAVRMLVKSRPVRRTTALPPLELGQRLRRRIRTGMRLLLSYAAEVRTDSGLCLSSTDDDHGSDSSAEGGAAGISFEGYQGVLFNGVHCIINPRSVQLAITVLGQRPVHSLPLNDILCWNMEVTEARECGEGIFVTVGFSCYISQ